MEPKKRISPLQRERYEMIQMTLIYCVLAIFCLIVINAMLGCASAPTAPAAPPPKYELLLTGSIDSVPFNGIGIGSAATTHQITVQSVIAVNYFTMESCHRALQFTDVIKVPWYDWSSDNKSFTFEYDEAPTIEDTGDCLLRFCAFSKTVGSPPVSCAIIDFKNPRYSLPAMNICNGAAGQASGTMFCHTQVGLIERVQFKEPVQIAPQVVDPAGKTAPYWISGQCQGKFLDAAQTLFEYSMPETECSIIFDQKAAPHARAKLTAVPYDTPLYQGGN